MHTESNHGEITEYKDKVKEESAENRHHPYDIHQIHSSHQMEDHSEEASFKKMSVNLRSGSMIRPAPQPQHFDISKLDYDLEPLTKWVYNIVFKDDIKNDEDAAMRICIASFGTLLYFHHSSLITHHSHSHSHSHSIYTPFFV